MIVFEFNTKVTSRHEPAFIVEQIREAAAAIIMDGNDEKPFLLVKENPEHGLKVSFYIKGSAGTLNQELPPVQCHLKRTLGCNVRVHKDTSKLKAYKDRPNPPLRVIAFS